jgi:HD superfamily phosphodiesterase
MGRFIAVIALAGAAAFAAYPAVSHSHAAHAASPEATSAKSSAAAPAATEAAALDDAMGAAERDFARRQAEVGLIGSAPLFGAEGLPKPVK